MKRLLRQLVKSKTLITSALLAVLGVVQANWGIVDDYLNPRLAGVAFVAIAALMAVLRLVTTQAVSEK